MTDWHPFPKQELALLADVDELLMGGARGPGKTECGQIWEVEPDYIENPKYRGLVIRRNSKDLTDWADRAEHLYRSCRAVRTGNPPVFTLPSGAKIRTGHLRDKNAYTQYQGHEYQKVLIEELTQIPREDDYEKLIASCRSTIGLKAKVFATTNPDGPGHEWVKARFCCDEPDMQIRYYKDEATGITRTRLFIPCNVEDNPVLIEKDPGYVAFLNNIKDEVLRKQWREGNWDDFDIEGAYYLHQLRQAKKEKRITNVPVDPVMPVHITYDLGVDTMRLWFFQVIGKEIRFIDYLAGDNIPGLENIAKEIQAKDYVTGYHYFPHDIEAREITTGKERIVTAKKLGMKPYLIAPKVSEADGINAVKILFPYFWFDKTRCKDGLWGLQNFTKDYDDENGMWINKPKHNWASHIAASIKSMALCFRWNRLIKTSNTSDVEATHQNQFPSVYKANRTARIKKKVNPITGN